MSHFLPGEPLRDREAEVPPDADAPNEDETNDDELTEGEPGSRHAAEPFAPTTPGASDDTPDDGGAR